MKTVRNRRPKRSRLSVLARARCVHELFDGVLLHLTLLTFLAEAKQNNTDSEEAYDFFTHVLSSFGMIQTIYGDLISLRYIMPHELSTEKFVGDVLEEDT